MHSSKIFAQLNRALVTHSIMKVPYSLAIDNTYYKLCAPHVHSPAQALSGESAKSSLSRHSSLVALCSLAFSQGGL